MTTQDQDADRTGSEKLVSTAALEFLRKLEALADSKVGLPISSHRKGPVGPLLVGLKKSFRMVFQVFINELMRKQAAFNETVVNLSYVTYREIQALQNATLSMRTGLGERIRKLEETVARLESQRAVATPNSIHGSKEKN